MMDELVAALRPFANCVFNDNGDVTYDYSHVEAADYFRAYRVLQATPAIAGVEPSQEVPARTCATCHAILADGPQPAATYTAQPLTEEERHAIAHARYQVSQASMVNPDCCFDYDLVKDLLRVIDRQSPQPPSEPTKEMALAGRKALAVVADRMEEAKLLATSLTDFWQRVGHEPANEIYKAMIEARPPVQEVEDTTEAFVELAQKFAEWRAHFEKQRALGSPYCSWQPEISDVEQMMALIEQIPQEVSATTREALYDANWKDADEFCRGALGHFVSDVSQYTEIVAELMKHATERALKGGGHD